MLLWLLDGKAAILVYILYLPYKTKFSNDRRPGYEYFKNHLTVSSDNTCSVKAVDLRSKKKEEDGEMGIFYNPSKIIKLVPFILIIDGTPKQHKMMPQKDFNQSLKGLSWF